MINNINSEELLKVLRKYICNNYDFKVADIIEDEVITITTNENTKINIYLQVEDCSED